MQDATKAQPPYRVLRSHALVQLVVGVAVCLVMTCLRIHHLEVVFCQVGDDYSEGVEHCKGAGGGEVQVRPHMKVQNM